MEEKLQNYNKYELNKEKEIKLLGKKILNEENSNQYPDISSMDDTDD